MTACSPGPPSGAADPRGTSTERSSSSRRDDEKPYFLEIATYAPHGNLDKPYAADRVFPPAFRDRPSSRRPGGNCGLRACPT